MVVAARVLFYLAFHPSLYVSYWEFGSLIHLGAWAVSEMGLVGNSDSP